MYNSRSNGILTVQRAHYKNWCNNRKLSASNIVTTPTTATINFNNVVQDNNGRSFPLPPELLLEILSYLSDCQPALHAASLVCKQWLYCVAPILYCHPQINDTYRWATFILTLTRERMSFFYGDLIRSIDLSSGKSIEAMKDQEFYRRLSNSNDDQLQQQRVSRANNNSNHNMLHFNNYDNIADRRTQLRLNIRNMNNNNNDTTTNTNGSVRFQQEQQDYVMKGLPFIIVSTSSLIQISHTCKNITSLNLSYTSLLYDSLIAETGEYLSTLQRYAVQPGLTHIQIPIEQAIQSIGKECTHLQEVKIQRCEWVTAHVIWMFVYHCPNLRKLDGRRSTKCTVKRLIANVLEDTSVTNGTTNNHLTTYTIPAATAPVTTVTSALQGSNSTSSNGSVGEGDLSMVLFSSSSSSTIDFNNNTNNNQEEEEEEEEEDEDDEEEGGDNVTVHFRFNEETGLYEQVEVPNQSRITLVRQLTEDMDDNNDAFWFVPLPSVEDEMHPIGRRPPSPMHPNQSINGVGNVNKSLKNIVYDILTDAKELGAIDLNWLQDY